MPQTTHESYAFPLPGPVEAAAPRRRPGSVRRTSHLDATRSDDPAPMGVSSITGAARDLLTTGDGMVVLDTASLRVDVGVSGLIERVEHEPVIVDVRDLVGAPVGFGFRSGVKDLLVRLSGTPLGLLVDDLSGAPAPSGYGAIRDRVLLGQLPDRPQLAAPAKGASQADVCAGWRTGGLPDRSRSSGAAMPFEAEPPVAPSLALDGDEFAWHPMGPLGARRSRRIRRLDLWREGDLIVVDAMFRDSTADPDLRQRVVHEYELEATLDASTFRVLSIEATPRALPFPTDCPFAAASASLIVGHPAANLRTAVRRVSRGPISCTHLNDLLRSLADVPGLAAQLY